MFSVNRFGRRASGSLARASEPLALRHWRLCVIVLVLAALPLTKPFAQDAGLKQSGDSRQAEINRAIDAAVESLKKAQQEDGSFKHEEHTLGLTCLCGWAMLEGGVPKKDPAMSKLVDFVRGNCLTSEFTYSISLAIIFLDRFGDPGDSPLIEALACQLLRQGGETGTWLYPCPEIPEPDRKVFTDLAKKARDQGPPPQNPKDKKKRRFSAEASQLLRTLKVDSPGGGEPSNTQFAMMALWVARRHGAPVDDTLLRVQAAFRKAQRADGWGYTFDDPMIPSTPALTCAGLLAYALGHGVSPQKKDPFKDAGVVQGMRALTAFMDKLSEKREDFFGGEQGGKAYYFLWSLERMAVVYDIKKVGERDWYRWGADLLLDHARGNRDNPWQGEYGIADTCFAVLFLKRANVAEDLTRQLNLFNPILKTPKK